MISGFSIVHGMINMTTMQQRSKEVNIEFVPDKFSKVVFQDFAVFSKRKKKNCFARKEHFTKQQHCP